MSLLQAFILAILEGLTEFLPVSSTGHMIIASSLMGIAGNEFVKNFTVIIQFGAILAVVVLYWRRFVQSLDFYIKLAIGVLPILLIGFLLKDRIELLLDNVTVVAVSLLVGGVVLLFVDRWFARTEYNPKATEVSPRTALQIGLFQCVALIPGVSRAASAIVGGLTTGLNRKAAAEFSFLLAVPTMFAATAYKLYKSYHSLHRADISLLAIGSVIAFVVALFAIRSFIGFLTKQGFFLFGVYRIVLGLVLLILIYVFHFSLQIV